MFTIIFPAKTKEDEVKYARHVSSTLMCPIRSNSGVTTGAIDARKEAYKKYLLDPIGSGIVYSVDDDIMFKKEHKDYVLAAEKLLQTKPNISGVLFLDVNDINKRLCSYNSVCEVVDNIRFYNVSGTYNGNPNTDKGKFLQGMSMLWLSGGLVFRDKHICDYINLDHVPPFEDRNLMYLLATFGKLVICPSPEVEHKHDIYASDRQGKQLLPDVAADDMLTAYTKLYTEHLKGITGKFNFNTLNFDIR